MSEERPQRIPFGHVVAVFVGNGLEFYDFLAYALFAVYIGKAFFPSNDPSLSTLISLATFGIGFITRPIGGIVLGSLGDRIGRKPAMMISFVLMGIGMLGLALTPTYASIGIVAPILVLLFRLIQGFALGGEVGPTTAYMIEAAPPHRRGLYGSMQYVTQYAGSLIAAFFSLILTNVLGAAQMESWGWRITFLIGVVIVPFGLYIRNRLPETLRAADDAALAPDAAKGTLAPRAAIAPYLSVIIFGLIMLTTSTIGAYVITYMTTYALDTLHFSADVAIGATIVTSGVACLVQPISGLLSDRFGRKPIIVTGFTMTMILVLPVFWMVNHYPSVMMFYGGMSLITTVFAIATPPVIVALTEALPMNIRSGAVATVYAFAISIFGGTTQFVIDGLIRLTHNPLAPAWYWMAAMVFGTVTALTLRETAPVKLEKRIV